VGDFEKALFVLTIVSVAISAEREMMMLAMRPYFASPADLTPLVPNLSC
jgi:hypothetical protein